MLETIDDENEEYSDLDEKINRINKANLYTNNQPGFENIATARSEIEIKIELKQLARETGEIYNKEILY